METETQRVGHTHGLRWPLWTPEDRVEEKLGQYFTNFIKFFWFQGDNQRTNKKQKQKFISYTSGLDWSWCLRILWTQIYQIPMTFPRWLKYGAQEKFNHSHWKGSERHMECFADTIKYSLQYSKCTSSLMIYITFIVFFDNQTENANSSHTWHELILFYKVKPVFKFFLPFACIF